jgi:hypothetical protein
MTDWPNKPTDAELDKLWTHTPGDVADALHAAWKAGVQAERARAAAETTEEWGYAHPDALDDIYEADDRESAELAVKYHRKTTSVLYVVVRRTASCGPWEVQS